METNYNRQAQLLAQYQQLRLLKFEFEDIQQNLDEVIEMFKNNKK